MGPKDDRKAFGELLTQIYIPDEVDIDKGMVKPGGGGVKGVCLKGRQKMVQ